MVGSHPVSIFSRNWFETSKEENNTGDCDFYIIGTKCDLCVRS